MGHVDAHHLLDKANKGLLILLVGPEYQRMQQMAAQAGIEVQEASSVQDPALTKLHATLNSRSLALIASVPEVEGILDRSAFGPHLVDLAYAADKVIYCGTSGAVLIHPQPSSTHIAIRSGTVHIDQEMDVVGPGEEIVGLRATRL